MDKKKAFGRIVFIAAIAILIWALMGFQKASHEANVLQDVLKQYCKEKGEEFNAATYEILDDGRVDILCFTISTEENACSNQTCA